jgi:GNAT superfamily N-acetyltransferase
VTDPTRLDPTHLQDVASVLAEAFADYPVLRWVLGEGRADSSRDLERLVAFFAHARFLRNEPVFGVPFGAGLGGVALLSHPDGPPSPPELGEVRERLWEQLGAPARERYRAYGEACRPLTVDVPHVHLNMIGVRSSAKGAGLGRRLLDRVHRYAGEHPGLEGVTLVTEDPANLPLYRHFGYELLGSAPVAEGLRTWGLYRPNSGEGMTRRSKRGGG